LPGASERLAIVSADLASLGFVDSPVGRVLDALDEGCAPPLDGVTAGSISPFPGVQIPAQEGLLKGPEGDGRAGRGGLLVEGDPAPDLVRAARQECERCLGLPLVGRGADGGAVVENLDLSSVVGHDCCCPSR